MAAASMVCTFNVPLEVLLHFISALPREFTDNGGKLSIMHFTHCFEPPSIPSLLSALLCPLSLSCLSLNLCLYLSFFLSLSLSIYIYIYIPKRKKIFFSAQKIIFRKKKSIGLYRSIIFQSKDISFLTQNQSFYYDSEFTICWVCVPVGMCTNIMPAGAHTQYTTL